MVRLFVFLLAVGLVQHASAQPIAFAIHGGAGTISRDSLSDTQRQAYLSALSDALNRGYRVLEEGGTAVDAVSAAIVLMESSPLFNAGVGAVLTWDETHELDASIMRGQDRQAGAVAGVKTIKHPILAAREVMQASPHVMLSGVGAEQFAQAQGLDMVTNDHFTTPRRVEALQRAKLKANKADKWGTVGAVALDQAGNLAAGTSTGGMTAKRWGRVGDSPIIGAGTFADNDSCAVSATGHGEYFIRYNVAADICARVSYLKLDVETAARQVIFDAMGPAGGTGGVIVVAPTGEVALVFNTEGMYRASIDAKGRKVIAIHNP